MSQTVLITGCSSGFGKLAAKTFSANGWNVMATMRSPEKDTELASLPGVALGRLDVVDRKNVQSVVQDTLKSFGRIDCLVNNAGYGGNALFEQFSDLAMNQMFATNVFGPVNTMRAVMPIMRAQKQGVIVNVSSMAGLVGLPGHSFYSASKFALNGLSEGMALESEAFGIRVHLIEPGAYPTTSFNASTEDHLDAGDQQLSDYSRKLRAHIEAIGQQMAQQGGALSDPQEVADKIYACATDPSMPIHNPTGADAEMLEVMIQTAGSRQKFIEQIAAMLLPQQ
ncbi:SDR family oxidoreductase [Roseibium sp.]|uniref:SDR family oxidoreductase n=1 Tax=Roseibium sp. TaxID=1936156 RepID=UPI003BAC8E95